MSPHQILVNAKNILLRDGWNKNAYTLYGSVCLLGAINKAQTGNAYGHKADSNVMEARFALGRSIGGGGIVPWNDAPHRTFDEVITALDQAILMTAPQEVQTTDIESKSTEIESNFKELVEV